MAQGILAPMSEQDMINEYLLGQQQLQANTPFPDIEGRRPIAGLGMLLPVDMADEGGDFGLAVPQVAKDFVNYMSQMGAGVRGEAPMLSPEEQAMGMMDFTGGGLLAGTPARMAAGEAGDVMLGSAGGRLTRKQYDPLQFGKVGFDIDRPLSEMEFDIDPIDLLGQRMIIKPEDVQGKILLFGAGDRSGTGILRGIEGQNFDEPVYMLGGRDYQLATPDAWASGQGVVTDILNRAMEAQKETGIEDVVLSHSTMGRGAVDFSEMSSSTLAEMLKNAKITKKAAKEFDDQFREKFPDFVGVQSPDLRKWLANVPSGKTRTLFAEQMDSKKYQDLGFPSPAKARFALTEPAQIEVPTFASGMSFQPLDVLRGSISSPAKPHASYSHSIGKKDGQLPTQFRDVINNHIFYRDFQNALERQGKTLDRRGRPLQSSAIQPSFRASIPYQVADQEWVDTMSGLLGY